MSMQATRFGALAASLLVLGSSAVFAGQAGPYPGSGYHPMNPTHHAAMHGGWMSAEQDRPKLGVAIAPLDQATLDELGIEFGVLIDGVEPGSVAEKTGLQAGDIVTALSDRPVYSPQRMQYLVGEAGDSMSIAALRDGKPLRLQAVFPSVTAGTASGPAVLGVRLQTMTPDLQEAFGATQGQGVLVSQVMKQSAAAEAGLKAGDVIVAFDTTPVSDVRALHEAVAARSPGDEVTLDILRQGKTMSINASLDSHPLAQVETGDYRNRHHGVYRCDMKKHWKSS